MNFNKVILMGNLTRDPETKQLPSGTTVCDFGLAVNRKWRDASGAAKEEACFVDCAAFGKTAETLAQFMVKGKPVLLEGRLKYETWEAKDGGKRSKLSVVVEAFQFVGGKSDGGGNGTAPAKPRQPEPVKRYAGDGSEEATVPAGDDIPF